MRKKTSYSIKLWYLLWTTWAFSLLLAITLIWGAPILDLYLDLYIEPPHIYVVFAIAFLNGLVLSSLIGFPSLVFEPYLNLAIAVLVGLIQWFLIYQLGRLWLLNWPNTKWYWKPLFPIFIVGYYIITGSLSIYLLVIAVD